jgi:hypothetical protein
MKKRKDTSHEETYHRYYCYYGVSTRETLNFEMAQVESKMLEKAQEESRVHVKHL